MQKTNKKQIFQLTYIFGTMIVILLIGLLDKNIENVFAAMASLDLCWLIACFACLFMFWLTDSFLLSHIVWYMHKKIPMLKSLKISIIGLYYGALTPFATGGQPMQVVYMKREGITYGRATSIMSAKFIIYELSLCFFYLVAMIFRGSYFYTNFNQVFWITTLGFLINLSSVALITFAMINKGIAYKICGGIINFLHRIKIIKNIEKTNKAMEKNIEEFHESTEYFKKHTYQFLISILLSLINLTFLFAIPYFIYVAFGHSEKTIIDLITMQSFLYLAVSFFPLPGAAGASEGGFYLFFASFFTNVPIFIAMLVWRFISYYSILIVGSLVVVGDEVLKLGRKPK